MSSANFKLPDSISVLPSLHNFNEACDSNRLYEDTVTWLFQDFMKDSAKAAVVHRVGAAKERFPELDRKSTTYCQLVKYLLATYATEDLIADIEVEITNFKQPEIV